MTQQRYLDLLSRIAIYERDPNEKTVPAKSPQELEMTIVEKMKLYEQEGELTDSDSSKLQ